MTIFFEEWVYGQFFEICHIWKIPKTFPMVWLSLDNSKSNFGDNYFISKFNYLHLYNYVLLFQLPIMDMKRQIVSFHVHDIYINLN